MNGNRLSYSKIRLNDHSFEKMTIFELKLRSKFVYIGKIKNEVSFVEILPDRIVLNNLHPKNLSTKYNITLPFAEMSTIRYCFCSSISAIFIQPIYDSFKKFSEWIKKNDTEIDNNTESNLTGKKSIPENFIMINLESDIDRIHMDQFNKAAIECNKRLHMFEINIAYACEFLRTPNKTLQSNRYRSSLFNNNNNNSNLVKRKNDDIKTEEIICIEDDDINDNNNDDNNNNSNDDQKCNNDKNSILDKPILKYPTTTTTNKDEEIDQQQKDEYNNNNNITPIILYGNDLKCLRNGQYLNDNIMNFYLKYYQLNGEISINILDKIHIFDTLFATHLLNVNTRRRQIKLERNSKMLICSDYDNLDNSYHKVLKKWTKDIDIFQKDFLFIPLVINGHWFLIILCYISNILINNQNDNNNQDNHENDKNSSVMITRQQCNNDDQSSNKNKPLLIVMDSLECNINRNQIISLIIRYLKLELKEKHSLDLMIKFKNISANVPQQQNTYDCGLFVLEYIERFLKEPDTICMKLLQDRYSLQNWFDSKQLHHKRAKIQQIIMNMLSPNDAKNLEEQLTRIQLAQHHHCIVRNGVIKSSTITIPSSSSSTSSLL